jgi:hypothetical protein
MLSWLCRLCLLTLWRWLFCWIGPSSTSAAHNQSAARHRHVSSSPPSGSTGGR